MADLVRYPRLPDFGLSATHAPGQKFFAELFYKKATAVLEAPRLGGPRGISLNTAGNVVYLFA